VGNARIGEGPDGKAEFWCGDVSGNVVIPLPQPLTGTFTATRINDPENLPDAVINCDGDIATFELGQ
jgi:hypothetical protein